MRMKGKTPWFSTLLLGMSFSADAKVSNFELETGYNILLETGDLLILEG